jgi:hypothetical protein
MLNDAVAQWQAPFATAIAMLAVVLSVRPAWCVDQASGNGGSDASAAPDGSDGSTEIRFYTVEQGRKVIVDETWQPYISAATDDFLRFSIGLDAEAPIPSSDPARRTFAEQKFAEKVLEFTDAEKTRLTGMVRQLSQRTAKDWPRLSRQPWKFLKVDTSFCGGFAHTRGRTIVLTSRHLQSMERDEAIGLTLLLHEQIHVLQRCDAASFEPLYKQYGFHPVELVAGEIQRVNVAQNPDAFELNWALRFGEMPSMLILVFDTGADGKLRFSIEYRRLIARQDGTYLFGEIIEREEAFRRWQNGYGLSIGLEHPNEVSAYLSSSLFRSDYLGESNLRLSELQAKRLEQTRSAFRGIMRVESGHEQE